MDEINFQTVTEVLQDIAARYPGNSLEAAKTMESLNLRGEDDPIVKKRLNNLLGNLPAPQSSEERDRRVAYASVIYTGKDNARDKTFAVRVTQEELLTLQEKALDEDKTLSAWVREKLGLDPLT